MPIDSDKKVEHGMHPNSLANLKPTWTSDSARESQKASVASRKINKEARDKLKISLVAWKELQNEMKDGSVSSVDMLKVMMFQKLNDGDDDTAIDIMKTLAEFERPKLARIESKVEEVKADDLTEAELDARIETAYKAIKDAKEG